ncbi:MAG: hypothetical protein QMD66_05405 [Actinomycetota bacterium]|nr:hypothetical protein [Actinomycetota bacterium]
MKIKGFSGVKKEATLIAVSVLCLILSGCITFTFETKINPDGSGRRIQDIALESSFARMLESAAKKSGKTSLKEELKKNLPKEGKLRIYTKKGKVHYEVSFDFKDIDELNRINKKLSAVRDISTNVKLTKKDSIFLALYDFQEKIPPLEATELEQLEMIGAYSIVYKLNMPGKIIKANTNEIEGETAIWDINPFKGKEIRAKSRYIRWWAISFLLFLLVLISAGGILLRKRG